MFVIIVSIGLIVVWCSTLDKDDVPVPELANDEDDVENDGEITNVDEDQIENGTAVDDSETQNETNEELTL